MSSDAATPVQNESIRHEDANVSQRRAANPLASTWVNASAGTGKTKVLTDRMLRLMLPTEGEQAGCPPHKIMALTFTKAAAGEMAQRILDRLARWSVIAETKLAQELTDLLGRAPNDHEKQAARRLFAEAGDAPGGLKVMTIHSFCQSVLSRFPLEAGLPPSFDVLEDRDAQALLRASMEEVLRDAAALPKATPERDALEILAATINQDQFETLLTAMVNEREQLHHILRPFNFDCDGFYTALCRLLDVHAGVSKEEMIHQTLDGPDVNEHDLKHAAEILIAKGSPRYQTLGHTMSQWISMTREEQVNNFDLLRSVFMTTALNPRKDLYNKGLEKTHPEAVSTLNYHARVIFDLHDTLARIDCANMTRDLIRFGWAVTQTYQDKKTRVAKLDYNDLIFTTLRLLQGTITGFNFTDAAQWVLFKLDQGIDHLLIDEAQDTNPEQWQILDTLSREFTAGEGARRLETNENTPRTIFTVGDEKQSIYSFQRAAPEEFQRMRSIFDERFNAAGLDWYEVNMVASFRSAPAILQVVDSVFATPLLQASLGSNVLPHKAHRSRQGARVELWPAYETEKTEALPLWETALQPQSSDNGPVRMARDIAATIRGWLDNGEILESQGRPIRAGDILILMKSRSTLMTHLMRTLKDQNLPLSGVDRMIINEEIAVQDILAAAEFALLPDDDLVLASLLKSPLIGLSEEALFNLAHGREATLWEALQSHTDHKDIAAYLRGLMTSAAADTPFEFISAVLHRPCPADTRSGLSAMKQRLGNDVTEALDELLNNALAYANSHIPSLQDFVHWQKNNAGEIKREIEEQGDMIRIMTVHGAKGLQAPIVFMPDTLHHAISPAAKADKKLLWPDKTGLDLPLWSPRKACDSALYQDAAETIKQAELDEYRRQLYVAMTRAEDRLYVSGATGKKKANTESWYFAIKDGLEALDGHEILEDGKLRFDTPQLDDPKDKTKKAQGGEQYTPSPPDWLMTAPRPERTPPSVLSPSRPDTPEPAALSPLEASNEHRFLRGNITHKLLELLPDQPPEKRQTMAEGFVARAGAKLSTEQQNSVVHETLAILNDPQYEALFGPGSQAEVPITGTLPDGRIISGQIDRLLITDEGVWIVDYKTNRPPPQSVEGVPDIYRRQLQAYSDTLAGIYPDRPIRCGLLWTDGPNLMWL